MTTKPTTAAIDTADLASAEAYSPWRDFLKRFVRNKPAIISFWILVVLVVIAVVFSTMEITHHYWPYSPDGVDLVVKLQGPSWRILWELTTSGAT